MSALGRHNVLVLKCTHQRLKLLQSIIIATFLVVIFCFLCVNKPEIKNWSEKPILKGFFLKPQDLKSPDFRFLGFLFAAHFVIQIKFNFTFNRDF